MSYTFGNNWETQNNQIYMYEWLTRMRKLVALISFSDKPTEEKLSENKTRISIGQGWGFPFSFSFSSHSKLNYLLLIDNPDQQRCKKDYEHEREVEIQKEIRTKMGMQEEFGRHRLM
jgi:hypothetical protein